MSEKSQLDYRLLLGECEIRESQAKASIRDYMDICEDLSRKLEEARLRIGELEAALKPFADEAAKWSSDIHFSDFIPALDVLGSACNNCGDDPGYEEAAFSVGDLRRARNELEGKSAEADREASQTGESSGAIIGPKD